MESRIVELERKVEVQDGRLTSMAKALANVVLHIAENVRQSADRGYSAASDPPPGVRPPRDTGLPLKPGQIPQSVVDKLVPAVAELQQLYLNMATHLNSENFEDRVSQLEADYAAMEDADELDSRVAESVARLDQVDVEFEALANWQRVVNYQITAIHEIKSKVAALDHVVCYQTVDPVVANWDRFEILDTLRHLEDQIAGILDTQAKIEGAFQQQDLLNAHFADQIKRLDGAFGEIRTWIIESTRSGWKGLGGR